MKGKEWQSIIGFPPYEVNLETGCIRNNGKMERKVSNRKSFTMKRDGMHVRVTWNRLRYAVEHHVDYVSIPPRFHIQIDEKGAMRVIEADDWIQWPLEARRRDAAQRLEYIERKLKEAQMMKRYYETGEIREVLLYLEEQRQGLVKRSCKALCCSQVNADLLFDEAVLCMTQRITSTRNTVADLTRSTYGLMMKMWRKGRILKSITNERVSYEVAAY